MKISTKPSKQRAILLSILAITITLVAAASIHRSAGLTQTPATFTNYELAGNEFIAGHSQGVTCPNAATDPRLKCFSTQAEPAIRADNAGRFYGSSESVFCVIGGQCGGTYAWRSTDGGGHSSTLSLPNTVTISNSSVAGSIAGSDTDLAVAPARNSNGLYNVYVASLHSSLANIEVSTSTDGGNNWSQHFLAANLPVDDREWLAADGQSKVCLSYHAVPTTLGIQVDCSYDAGFTFAQTAIAFDVVHAPIFLGANNKIGNMAIDPHNHLVYQSWSSVADNSEIAGCATGCAFHTVWIGVSIDGGRTFTDYIVYNSPNNQVDYGHSFVNLSVDKAGNVYAVYSDDHNMYYSFSRTFGKTWSGPFKVNSNPANTAIFPWSSAGNEGQLDIVYYGTSYTDGATVPTDFPPYPSTAATWYVYFAQNLNAISPNSPFTQVKASGVVHYGDVCELGAGCGSNQNRDLLDDIGIAASPTTGRAAIIYTSDQYVNSTLEPANTYGSRHCTAAAENTVDCSHTNIAAQMGGSTVNQKPHHFEVDDEDFEELDTSNDGGHSPHHEIDITNTGTGAIDKLDIGIGGLPWTVNWNSIGPIQPGQTVQGTSTVVPTGLLLVVGNVYQVTVTATLADGTTETQTVNVIYSLGAGLGL